MSTLPHPDSESAVLHHRVLLSGSVGITIAAVTTVIRLIIRLWKRYRLAWDDVFAIAALLLLIITAVSGKLYYSIDAQSTLPQRSRVALYYIFAVTFDMTVWTARLSILSTIIYFGFYTRFLKAIAAVFVTIMAVLVAQVFWVCEPQNRLNHWKMEPNPQCILGRSVAITQVTTDAFADIVLITSPLLILRHIKSQELQAQRVRLSASFAVAGLTTIVSVVHAFYLFRADLTSIVVSNVELSVSVIICNFVVLAAALHRLITSRRSTPPKPANGEITTLMFEASPPNAVSSAHSGSESIIAAEKIPESTLGAHIETNNEP